ncbi:late histone H1-like [Nylanderia fulva]|uniref:late histone H1-like n=1 Tax=Nylanderia fulva TaxID=613905 RepID=UPI0010FAFDC9|nr:late histone H1-like [Nylanderia fulva]
MEDKVNTSNSAAEAAEGNPTPAKKTNKSKAKSQEKKASRPATSEMVTTAIKELKDQKGSSLQAIKKYIVATYKVDGEKVAPFIRRYLKAAVSSGTVVQTKGKGASGSFKLSTDNSKPKAKAKVKRAVKPAAKKDKIEKTTTTRKPVAAKKPAAKKAESPKKPAQKKTAAAAKSVAKKKSKAAVETKSPSKAKKAVKAPAAKTKTPKPKKAATKAVIISAKK